MAKRRPHGRRGAGILLALAITAAAVVMILGCIQRNKPAKLETTEEIVLYMSNLGWQVEETPLSVQNIRLPESFPPVLEQYNALQQQQGFDLLPYAGKEAKLYTFKILNYSGDNSDGEVYACLYLYKGRVIGGDVHSAAFTGFMEGLR